jgi:hypothetical protein
MFSLAYKRQVISLINRQTLTIIYNNYILLFNTRLSTSNPSLFIPLSLSFALFRSLSLCVARARAKRPHRRKHIFSPIETPVPNIQQLRLPKMSSSPAPSQSLCAQENPRHLRLPYQDMLDMSVYSKPRGPWPLLDHADERAKNEPRSQIRLIREIDATVPHNRSSEGTGATTTRA